MEEQLAPPTDPVPDDGYRWWYVDAISDDGQHALTAIVFIGSVFSPWYAFARRRGPTPALEHCAVNVALYGPRARWCMTERGRAAVRADATSLSIGPSRLEVGEGGWRLTVDERSAPFGQRLRGSVEIDADPRPVVPEQSLDAGGLHRWQPIRPQTRLKVSMRDPELSWEGAAYVDTNRGSVPLERTFDTWHWSRAHAADGSTLIRYDVIERGADVPPASRTLAIAADGTLTEGAAGERRDLGSTRWFRVPRPTRLGEGAEVERLRTFEDTPFYSRSHFVERVGERGDSVVHESLDMGRFVNPLVQGLLPFRTPRRFGAGSPGRPTPAPSR